MKNKLYDILTTSLFCIEQQKAEKYINLINSGEFFGNDDVFEKKAINFVDLEGKSKTQDEAKNFLNIALIPLSGVVMKNDGICGEEGTSTKALQVIEANQNNTTLGIILVVDTPGGMVDGTSYFADVIKKSKKPVVAVIDGMCCSAGYWIAAACEKIYSNSSTNQIGSVGAMIKLGIRKDEHSKTIVSEGSPDKNKVYFEAMTGNDEPMKEEILNPLYDIFVKSITEKREIKEEALTGKTYYTEKAIELGLIDEVGDIEKAINYILDKQI